MHYQEDRPQAYLGLRLAWGLQAMNLELIHVLVEQPFPYTVGILQHLEPRLEFFTRMTFAGKECANSSLFLYFDMKIDVPVNGRVERALRTSILDGKKILPHSRIR